MSDLMDNKNAILELAKASQKFREMVFSKKIYSVIEGMHCIDGGYAGYNAVNNNIHMIWPDYALQDFTQSRRFEDPDNLEFDFAGFHPDGNTLSTSNHTFGPDSSGQYIITSGWVEYLGDDIPCFLIMANHKGHLCVTLVEPLLTKELLKEIKDPAFLPNKKMTK